MTVTRLAFAVGCALLLALTVAGCGLESGGKCSVAVTEEDGAELTPPYRVGVGARVVVTGASWGERVDFVYTMPDETVRRGHTGDIAAPESGLRFMFADVGVHRVKLTSASRDCETTLEFEVSG